MFQIQKILKPDVNKHLSPQPPTIKAFCLAMFIVVATLTHTFESIFKGFSFSNLLFLFPEIFILASELFRHSESSFKTFNSLTYSSSLERKTGTNFTVIRIKQHSYVRRPFPPQNSPSMGVTSAVNMFGTSRKP